MGGEDPDSLDLERLNDLYVVDNLAIAEMEEMPDIFSSDAPAIDASPEATAAFDTFVNELDGTVDEVEEKATQQGDGVLGEASVDSGLVTSSEHLQLQGTNAVGVQSSSTSYSNAPSAQQPTSSEYFPDRLDLRALRTHALPLNVSANANLHTSTTRASTPYGNGMNLFLQDSDALKTQLALPTRSWTIPRPNPSSHPSQHDTIVPISHSIAASRGRPRVREMKHVPLGSMNGNTSAPSTTAKLRYSKGAAPSKYCHVCGRSAKTVSVALCGNNRLGLCRKVVCDKCLLMHQRDSWELAKREGGGWICMHCRNQCPERARCHQYQRNNLKRRMRAAAPPTPKPQPTSVNIRRPATGRIMKGVRAPVTAVAAVRRTVAMNADIVVDGEIAPEGTLHFVPEPSTEIQMLDDAKVPQMIDVGTEMVTSHKPITVAELDEHVMNGANSQMMLHYEETKAEAVPLSIHSESVKEIVSGIAEHNENVVQFETSFKQQQEESQESQQEVHSEAEEYGENTEDVLCSSRSNETVATEMNGKKDEMVEKRKLKQDGTDGGDSIAENGVNTSS